jgi:transposase
LSVPAAAAAKAGGLSAKTVSKWCNRLRERSAAEREAGLEKSDGHIEVDGPYFGVYREGKRERGGKIPVCGLLKRGGEVRVILPPNCSEKQLPGSILENVELDSIVHTDD